MSLSDLDRQIVEFNYARWDRTIRFRPITAFQLVGLQADFGEVNGEDATSRDVMSFYAELLAASVIDPQYSASEWLNDASGETIMSLGLEALRINGLAVEDAKKK